MKIKLEILWSPTEGNGEGEFEDWFSAQGECNRRNEEIDKAAALKNAAWEEAQGDAKCPSCGGRMRVHQPVARGPVSFRCINECWRDGESRIGDAVADSEPQALA